MMATQMTAGSARFGFEQLAAAGASPANLAQYKIDRLRELRAVIDSLRREPHQDSAPEWSSGRRPNAAR
jgi:hypothetical protein